MVGNFGQFLGHSGVVGNLDQFPFPDINSAVDAVMEYPASLGEGVAFSDDWNQRRPQLLPFPRTAMTADQCKDENSNRTNDKEVGGIYIYTLQLYFSAAEF